MRGGDVAEAAQDQEDTVSYSTVLLAVSVAIVGAAVVVCCFFASRRSGVLSDRAIVAAMERGDIRIEPFDAAQLGGNSYDVRLARVLRVHATASTAHAVVSSGLDDDPSIGVELVDLARSVWGLGSVHSDWTAELSMAEEPRTIDVRIPDEGILLVPGVLYLASTVEYTETLRHVPYLDGRSSVGRLGISIHVTAGRGDVGFCNHWTMEVWVVQPVRVFADVRIGQLTYHTVAGRVDRRYSTKPDTTYGKLTRDSMPQPSRMWSRSPIHGHLPAKRRKDA